MLIYSCTDGVSLGPGHCQMIMQPALTDRALEDMPPSLLLEWSRDRGLSTREADCPLIRLAVLPVPEQQLFACGRLGYIARIHRGLLAQETIEGPHDQGFLRDLRVIGTHLYAAGMGRQVYRRHHWGRWTHWDAGLLHNSEDVLDIRGINAIDGFTEDDMYAVGFQGEIWRYVRGAWHEVESPTNLILERVRVILPDRAYSAGQVGTLLRGHGDAWEHVKQTTTEDDFWGMEWFRDRLYLATRNGLYVLVEDDELEPVDTGLPGPRTSAQLHAANGALWSFGPQHLAWTEDGTTWNDVVLGP